MARIQEKLIRLVSGNPSKALARRVAAIGPERDKLRYVSALREPIQNFVLVKLHYATLYCIKLTDCSSPIARSWL